jgi:hypothetical protein
MAGQHGVIIDLLNLLLFTGTWSNEESESSVSHPYPVAVCSRMNPVVGLYSLFLDVSFVLKGTEQVAFKSYGVAFGFTPRTN